MTPGSQATPKTSGSTTRKEARQYSTGPMSKSPNHYVIWQWNCRGYQRKRHNLQMYIDQLETANKPDVIALQETGVIAKLAGYASYTQPAITGKPPIATLVRRNIPAKQKLEGVSAAMNKSRSALCAGDIVAFAVLPGTKESESFYGKYCRVPLRCSAAASDIRRALVKSFFELLAHIWR